MCEIPRGVQRRGWTGGGIVRYNPGMASPNTRGDSVRQTVTLSPAIASALAAHCEAHDATPSEVVRLALIDRLDLDPSAAEMGKRGPKPAAKPEKRKAKRESRESGKKV